MLSLQDIATSSDNLHLIKLQPTRCSGRQCSALTRPLLKCYSEENTNYCNLNDLLKGCLIFQYQRVFHNFYFLSTYIFSSSVLTKTFLS